MMFGTRPLWAAWLLLLVLSPGLSVGSFGVSSTLSSVSQVGTGDQGGVQLSHPATRSGKQHSAAHGPDKPKSPQAPPIRVANPGPPPETLLSASSDSGSQALPTEHLLRASWIKGTVWHEQLLAREYGLFSYTLEKLVQSDSLFKTLLGVLQATDEQGLTIAHLLACMGRTKEMAQFLNIVFRVQGDQAALVRRAALESRSLAACTGHKCRNAQAAASSQHGLIPHETLVLPDPGTGQEITVKLWGNVTPLECAVSHGHMEVAKLLLQSGVAPGNVMNTAAAWGHTQQLQLAIKAAYDEGFYAQPLVPWPADDAPSQCSTAADAANAANASAAAASGAPPLQPLPAVETGQPAEQQVSGGPSDTTIPPAELEDEPLPLQELPIAASGPASCSAMPYELPPDAECRGCAAVQQLICGAAPQPQPQQPLQQQPQCGCRPSHPQPPSSVAMQQAPCGCGATVPAPAEAVSPSPKPAKRAQEALDIAALVLLSSMLLLPVWSALCLLWRRILRKRAAIHEPARRIKQAMARPSPLDQQARAAAAAAAAQQSPMQQQSAAAATPGPPRPKHKGSISSGNSFKRRSQAQSTADPQHTAPVVARTPTPQAATGSSSNSSGSSTPPGSTLSHAATPIGDATEEMQPVLRRQNSKPRSLQEQQPEALVPAAVVAPSPSATATPATAAAVVPGAAAAASSTAAAAPVAPAAVATAAAAPTSKSAAKRLRRLAGTATSNDTTATNIVSSSDKEPVHRPTSKQPRGADTGIMNSQLPQQAAKQYKQKAAAAATAAAAAAAAAPRSADAIKHNHDSAGRGSGRYDQDKRRRASTPPTVSGRMLSKGGLSAADASAHDTGADRSPLSVHTSEIQAGHMRPSAIASSSHAADARHAASPTAGGPCATAAPAIAAAAPAAASRAAAVCEAAAPAATTAQRQLRKVQTLPTPHSGSSSGSGSCPPGSQQPPSSCPATPSAKNGAQPVSWAALLGGNADTPRAGGGSSVHGDQGIGASGMAHGVSSTHLEAHFGARVDDTARGRDQDQHLDQRQAQPRLAQDGNCGATQQAPWMVPQPQQQLLGLGAHAQAAAGHAHSAAAGAAALNVAGLPGRQLYDSAMSALSAMTQPELQVLLTKLAQGQQQHHQQQQEQQQQQQRAREQQLWEAQQRLLRNTQMAIDRSMAQRQQQHQHQQQQRRRQQEMYAHALLQQQQQQQEQLRLQASTAASLGPFAYAQLAQGQADNGGMGIAPVAASILGRRWQDHGLRHNNQLVLQQQQEQQQLISAVAQLAGPSTPLTGPQQLQPNDLSQLLGGGAGVPLMPPPGLPQPPHGHSSGRLLLQGSGDSFLHQPAVGSLGLRGAASWAGSQRQGLQQQEGLQQQQGLQHQQGRQEQQRWQLQQALEVNSPWPASAPATQAAANPAVLSLPDSLAFTAIDWSADSALRADRSSSHGGGRWSDGTLANRLPQSSMDWGRLTTVLSADVPSSTQQQRDAADAVTAKVPGSSDDKGPAAALLAAVAAVHDPPPGLQPAAKPDASGKGSGLKLASGGSSGGSSSSDEGGSGRSSSNGRGASGGRSSESERMAAELDELLNMANMQLGWSSIPTSSPQTQPADVPTPAPDTNAAHIEAAAPAAASGIAANPAGVTPSPPPLAPNVQPLLRMSDPFAPLTP